MLSAHKVSIFVRMRPLNAMEITEKRPIVWYAMDDDQSINSSAARARSYQFERTFHSLIDNRAVFTSVGLPLVHHALRGIHSCLFCHGATGSGKTYSMYGGMNEPGIVNLLIEELFREMNDASDHAKFVLSMDCFEIANEHIVDLLRDDDNGIRKHAVYEDDKKQVHITNLTRVVINNIFQVRECISAACIRRHTEKTLMNQQSSRSHSVLRLFLESASDPDADEDSTVPYTRHACIALVDLAGSENSLQSGSKTRQQESSKINQSLLSLTRTISNLSMGIQSAAKIVWRESLLTRVLKNYLEGDGKIHILCCISPTNYAESNNTLTFAKNAKNLQCTLRVHENEPDQAVLITQLLKEIEQLRSERDSLRTSSSVTHRSSFSTLTNTSGSLLTNSSSCDEKVDTEELSTIEPILAVPATLDDAWNWIQQLVDQNHRWQTYNRQLRDEIKVLEDQINFM